MKLSRLVLAVVVVLFLAAGAWAAGSCTQAGKAFPGGSTFTVTITCIGDSSNGSVPNTVIGDELMTVIKRGTHFLYSVTAYPGATAPDAADVTVSMLGRDLLGGKGVNLIHATATQSATPYNVFSGLYEYPAIIDTVTVGVANQATASANWTIVLDFER